MGIAIWIKAFHLISIITWFAGLFYLPRLFVYHSMAEDEISLDRFKVMERRLLLGIMTPSMLFVLFLGGWLIWLNPSYLNQGWMHAKLLFVFLLIIYHHWCVILVKKFKMDANNKSHSWYRWFNEVPTVLLISIVILTVVKPF